MGRAAGFLVAMLLAPWLAATAASASDPVPTRVWGNGPNHVAVATGSPGDTGLLERLATEFAGEDDARVSWYRAGSGSALQLLKQRKVDLVLAHSPVAEQQAVQEGWATGRALVGSNEFWIVGPSKDPAGIANAQSAPDAMRRIARSEVPFVTRGDQSGTHQRELALWAAAGVTPQGSWYIVSQDFMKASLQLANDRRAYFLTDSSTFIVERGGLPELRALYRGGAELANPYHVLYADPPTPGGDLARRFGDFILSQRGQELIGRFGRGRYGEPLYRDAARSTAAITSGPP
jgi:tungstate transport system substrate-binding protein